MSASHVHKTALDVWILARCSYTARRFDDHSQAKERKQDGPVVTTAGPVALRPPNYPCACGTTEAEGSEDVL